MNKLQIIFMIFSGGFYFMNRKKEVLILGFALFAMFFGAGNLIFPPSLGIAMGKDWLLAGIGFLLTGVGLPLLGVLAFTKVGKLEDFSVKISSRFNTLYCTALVIVIGPLFAIPRTGSTTFEMGVLPSFPNTESVYSFGYYICDFLRCYSYPCYKRIKNH